jgi:hypothetical protein
MKKKYHFENSLMGAFWKNRPIVRDFRGFQNKSTVYEIFTKNSNIFDPQW